MTEKTDMNLLVTDNIKENGPHNEPQDLVALFLGIQIAIIVRSLCLPMP